MARDNINDFLANANVPEHDKPTFGIGRKSGPKDKRPIGTVVHLTSKRQKAKVNNALVSATTVLSERADLKARKMPRLETQVLDLTRNAKRLEAEIAKLRQRIAPMGNDVPLPLLQQLGRKVHKRDIAISRIHSILAELDKQNEKRDSGTPERILHLGLTDSHGNPVNRSYGALPMPEK